MAPLVPDSTHAFACVTFEDVATVLAPTCQFETMPTPTFRIALLHLAPIPGDIIGNRRLVEKAVTAAAGLGSTWIITPELIVTGYTFADSIGTEWILPQPDVWMTHMSRLAAQLRVTLFLSCPEQDRKSRNLYNSLFAIAADGAIVGTHRKVHTLQVGSEAWSSPGTQAVAIRVPPFTRIGMLICADAFTSEIARNLQNQGAQLLVSSAAWAPGHHGPNGEWERCTRDTGLPLIVCNRTGPDRTLDFRQAESVVAKDGKRLLSLSSARSAVFVIEWDLGKQTLATEDYQTLYL